MQMEPLLPPRSRPRAARASFHLAAAMLALLAASLPAPGADVDHVPRAGFETPRVAAVDFPVNQELVYRIYWGWIPVGEAVVTTGWTNSLGRDLLFIRSRAKTNKVLSKLWPVDDVIETLVDPERFRPVSFMKNLKEGGYRCHELTLFDFTNRVARQHNFTNGNDAEFPIDSDTRDLMTFMYYGRAIDFEAGGKYYFRVMADDKTYDLYVTAEAYEDVETVPGEEIPSVRLFPEAAFQGLFVHKGKGWMWVARDKRRPMTKMAVQVPVASVKLLLDEVRNTGSILHIDLPPVAPPPAATPEGGPAHVPAS